MWEDGRTGDERPPRRNGGQPPGDLKRPRSEMEWKPRRQWKRPRRSVTNAFTQDHRTPHERRPASLPTMHAALESTSLGWLLRLCPMQAADLFRSLARADQHVCALDQKRSRLTLVLAAGIDEWDDNKGLPALTEAAHGLGLARESGGPHLVLEDNALLRLLNVVPLCRIWAVRVDGPIEPRDAEAMIRATDAGESPLATELRAIAEIDIRDDRTSVVEARHLPAPLELVCENLRQYLAATCDRSVGNFKAPRPDQVHRLLDAGAFTVRPIETQIYPSFIDVGVCAAPEPADGPANRSLIYDLPSRTWHDE